MNNQSKSSLFMIDNLLSNNNEPSLPLKKRACLASVQAPSILCNITNKTNNSTNFSSPSSSSQFTGYFNHSTPSGIRVDTSISPSNDSLFQNYYVLYAAMANNRLINTEAKLVNKLQQQYNFNSSGYSSPSVLSSSMSPSNSDSSFGFKKFQDIKQTNNLTYEDDSESEDIEMEDHVEDEDIEEEEDENEENIAVVKVNVPKQVVRRHGERREKREWVCETCNKVFDRPSLLQRHIRTHTGEKPHVCDVCGKPFSTSSSLNTHRRIHSGEKPHACGICGKKFTASSNLYYHKLTHTSQKPHQCTLCFKSFSTPGDLRGHMHSHNGTWPFRCEICNRGFTKQTNMKNHMLTHTGAKPFSCTECDKHFSLACNLKSHMKTHHGISNDRLSGVVSSMSSNISESSINHCDNTQEEC